MNDRRLRKLIVNRVNSSSFSLRRQDIPYYFHLLRRFHMVCYSCFGILRASSVGATYTILTTSTFQGGILV